MYLAIDYGKKRIGLAVGEVLPKGAGVLDAAKQNEAIDKIADFCKKNEIDLIVLGNPIRSQGEEGTLFPEIKQFGKDLADKTRLPVYFEQEQFTSSEARIQAESLGRKPSDYKIDEIAACLILEQFIQRINQEGKEQIQPDIWPSIK